MHLICISNIYLNTFTTTSNIGKPQWWNWRTRIYSEGKNIRNKMIPSSGWVTALEEIQNIIEMKGTVMRKFIRFSFHHSNKVHKEILQVLWKPAWKDSQMIFGCAFLYYLVLNVTKAVEWATTHLWKYYNKTTNKMSTSLSRYCKFLTQDWRLLNPLRGKGTL